MTTPDAAKERAAMVERLERQGFARSPRVLDALAAVPRERFVPDALAEKAYQDEPLAIGDGQTISAPHMVAIMADALDAAPGHRVLEVGGGSGYHAAVLAHVVGPRGHVWAVERVAHLAERAEAALAATGHAGAVTVVVGDGSRGLPEFAPYDRVSVACAAPEVPPPLVQELARGGRLVVPVGGRDAQRLLRVTKLAVGGVETEDLGFCRFVPLVGAHGFPPEAPQTDHNP